MNARAAGQAGNVGRRTTRMNVRIQPELFHKMLGTRSAKRRASKKERNEHRLGAGRCYPRELGRWHTSSLNLASEPRTPPVWMCARWIVFIRRKAAPKIGRAHV